MSADWPLKKLSDVAEFLNNKRVPLKSLDRDKRQGEYPYYGASGVVDYIDDYVFDGVFLLISEDGENLRTRNTPVAFKASGKFWVNNHAHILAEKEEGILDYLEYYFSKLDISPYITGAVQPKLNKANLDSIEIPIPPKEERLGINKVLNSFTYKIELNRQTNQTLEHIAQALFKCWFVDFEPTRAKIIAKEKGANTAIQELAAQAIICGVITLEQLEAITQNLETTLQQAINEKLSQANQTPIKTEQLKTTAALFPNELVDSELGEIPEGWEVNPLGNYLEIKRGGSPRPIKEYIVEDGLPWTKIADATKEPSPFLFRTKEYIKEEGLKKTVLLKKGSLILSNSATPGLPKFLELDACIHDGWLHFPKKQLFSDLYLYQLFLKIRKELVAQGNGSVFTNLKTDILKSKVVVAPNQMVISKFDETISLAFNKLKENCKETNTLVEIRDALLPKLLSGELSVSSD